MKKKCIATILVTMLSIACLTGCGGTVDPKVTTAERAITSENSVDEATDNNANEANSKNPGKNNSGDKSTLSENAKETPATTEKAELTESTTTEAATEATTEDHTYDGLAVAKYHNVTLTKGTSYNDAIDEVIKGTSAYPNTFPNIYDVDLDTPGEYECYWEKDGEVLTYAKFTVTITE